MQYLALLLNLELVDRAVGGATTDNDFSELPRRYGFEIPSSQQQISSVLDASFTADPHDVAMLEIGTNDFIAYPNSLVNKTIGVDRFVEALSDIVIGQLDQLAAAGLDSILLTNLENFSILPHYSKAGDFGAGRSTVLKYNALLETKVSCWRKTHKALVAMVDMYQMLSIAASPAISQALGISNTTGSCIDTYKNPALASASRAAINDNGETICTDPSRFFFTDDLHPNERFHRLLGYYSWKLLQEQKRGRRFDVTTANLLELIKTFNLDTRAPKPASVEILPLAMFQ
ncbi:hypothetical protein GGF46_003351 [Coemansia sp. RSA 552]|nr:hypothetical protein GGF46_003351 [Coemansia sp. RSA 552]